MTITENMIQETLAKKFFNDFFVCNKFYSDFEADFLRVTSAGFMYEYEIKISISDFRNDFKKECTDRYRRGEAILKHDMIRSGALSIKHFYFCAPAGIIPVEEVPDEFGLFEFSKVDSPYPANYLDMDLTKKPTAMSEHKVDRAWRVKMMEKTYWDYKHRMCEKAKGEWLK